MLLYLFSCHPNHVSILLVVELAFEVQQEAPDVWRQLVSILLVVELAFEERENR